LPAHYAVQRVGGARCPTGVRIWVALVIAAGCARPAPRPRPHAEPTNTVVQPGPPPRPRPPFSVTFLLAALPPPLTRAPALAPALQVPPYWPTVCDRRGRVDDEVLEYIIAWCAARSGRLDELAGNLDRIRHSANHDLREAVAEDLANLALEGTPVDMEPRVVDYLAAIHVFRDAPRAALEVLEPKRWPPPRPESCQRTLLRILVAFDRATFERLASFRGQPCTRDAELLLCAGDRALQSANAVAEQDSVGGMCGGRVMTDAEIARVRLVEAYWRWRADEPATWAPIVTAAIDAMTDVPGSEELAVTIVEDESALCKPAMHDDARALARLVSMAPGHDARFDARIARVVGHEPPCGSEP